MFQFQTIFANRRRLAPIVLVAGIALIAIRFFPELPGETELRLALGPDHRQVKEVRLEYIQNGEEIRSVTFRFPDGAPFELVHRTDLPSGVYQLAIERLSNAGKTERIVRTLQTPAPGAVRVRAY